MVKGTVAEGNAAPQSWLYDKLDRTHPHGMRRVAAFKALDEADRKKAEVADGGHKSFASVLRASEASLAKWGGPPADLVANVESNVLSAKAFCECDSKGCKWPIVVGAHERGREVRADNGESEKGKKAPGSPEPEALSKRGATHSTKSPAVRTEKAGAVCGCSPHVAEK